MPEDIEVHDLRAEQDVLGALLLEEDFYKLEGILSGDDFFAEIHSIIFNIIKSISDAGEVVDILVVRSRFIALKKPGYEDGTYLGDLAMNVYNKKNMVKHAQIVRDKSDIRKILACAENIKSFALTANGLSADERMDKCQALLGEIKSDAKESAIVIDAALQEAFDAMESARAGETKKMGVGLESLDEKLVDFAPGALVVLAARPGMGKTSFMLQAAMNCAEKYGSVIIFSLEMSKMQLALRMLSTVSQIALTKLISGTYSDYEKESLQNSRQKLKSLPIKIDDRGGLTIDDISGVCRRMNKKTKLRLVAIDYLQLMSMEGENRNLAVSNVTNKLKSLAKTLDCPILLLSQLNRSVDSRESKRPVMSDLRDSGAIEQDADLILFPYRDEVYHPDSPDRGTVEICIAKQRNGPTDTVRAAWIGETTTFANLDYQDWLRQREALSPMQNTAPKKRGL